MKRGTRAIAFILALITIFSLCATCVWAAEWKFGNFDGSTTVYLTNTKKNAYIKIHSYNCVKGHHTGKCFGTGETSTKLKITFRDTSGRWICQFNAKSKEKLKLGNDHKAYRVYIACRQDLGSAANFTNLGKCTHWGVETVSNCHF